MLFECYHRKILKINFGEEKKLSQSHMYSKPVIYSWPDVQVLKCFISTHLDKFLNRLEHLHVEGFGLNSTQIHVAQEAVDDL